jgi:hypothetical protein
LELPSDDNPEPEQFNVLEFILDEIEGDEIQLETLKYRSLFELIASRYDDHGFDPIYYIENSDEAIQNLFIDLITFRYNLDNWERMEIYVDNEEKKLRRAVTEGIYAYKSKRVERMIRENQQMLKDQVTLGGDGIEFLEKQLQLEGLKRKINEKLGRTVLH